MREGDYDNLISIIRQRRSVRKFEPGRSVSRETLAKIAEAGRWAPSGANVQPWDFVVIEDSALRDEVIGVFMRQAERLKEFAQGFPAVYKTYLNNTVAIVIVLGDPRWKVNFPHGVTEASEQEYAENNENIFFSSLGAAIQNIQLAVTACGLTSAWLSGGGEATTSSALSDLLGYPKFMRAYGTIPIGYPAKDIGQRFRRPLDQVIHWNGYEGEKYRTDEQLEFHHQQLRPFTMYRNVEDAGDWDDADERLGPWRDAYCTGVTNPGGKLPG
jgi:nitroreductase